MPRRDVDPLASFNFQVDSNSLTIAAFSECSGLTTESDAIDYREGEDKANIVRKLPGLTKISNVVLKRGVVINALTLWEWRKSVEDGDPLREDITIALLDEKREVKAKWKIKEAWPIKYTGPELKASANEIAIESLELIHEGIERAQ